MNHVEEFQAYLITTKDRKSIDQANPDDLLAYIEAVESEPSKSAKLQLWALIYYFDYLDSQEMGALAVELRQQRIKRRPFLLKHFRGVNPVDIDKLTEIGIDDVEQMLQAGNTPVKRKDLSAQSGVTISVITELVKLSDLARISGLKSIRARLYYDGGIDTVEKLAGYDPKDLRQKLIDFVEKTGFDGIAPLPKEAEGAVKQAKKLPWIVQYD